MLASLVLYHGLAQTSRVEYSTASGTGPWTEVWLTSPTPLTAANYIFGAVGALFADEGDKPLLEHLGTDYWVRADATLWELWGFAGEADPSTGVIHVTTGIYGTDPQGLLSRGQQGLEIGTSFPLEAESVETAEYRGGRATSLHYGRVTELEVTFLVPAETWAAYEDSPVLMGHGALYIQTREYNTQPLSESELDGSFVCYPIEVAEVLNEGPEDVVAVRLRATMEDPT